MSDYEKLIACFNDIGVKYKLDNIMVESRELVIPVKYEIERMSISVIIYNGEYEIFSFYPDGRLRK